MRPLDVTTYSFRPEDGILIDASALINVYGPRYNTRAREIERYSKAIRCAQDAGSELLTASLVISEFAGVWLRLELEKAGIEWQRARRDKSIRSGPTYQRIADDIAEQVEYLLGVKDLRTVDDAVDQELLTRCVRRLAEGRLDLNDLILDEICLAEGLLLMTDDADFAFAKC